MLKTIADASSKCVCTMSQAVKMSTTSAARGKLSGKVAIVTASTEGIGYAIAKRLGQDGSKVMISSRRQANVDAALERLKAESLDVEGMVCHVGKPVDRTSLIEKTVERFGGVDILVSNAAVSPHFGPILDTSEQAWDKVFDINLKVAFMLTKEIVPYMEKRGGGCVMFISSIAAYQPEPLIGAYGITKTALLGLTKALTPQLADMNIRVNNICPGIIKTKLSEALVQNEDVAERMKQLIAMRRFGVPDDIGGMASFLASEDAGYITGESFVVAGGMPSHL